MSRSIISYSASDEFCFYSMRRSKEDDSEESSSKMSFEFSIEESSSIPKGRKMETRESPFYVVEKTTES